MKYDANGRWRGLSLGPAWSRSATVRGDNQNDFALPAYARVDSMVQYSFRPPEQTQGQERHAATQRQESLEHDLLSKLVIATSTFSRRAPNDPRLHPRGTLKTGDEGEWRTNSIAQDQTGDPA